MNCPKCNNRVKTNEAGYLECPACGYEPTVIDALNEVVKEVENS